MRDETELDMSVPDWWDIGHAEGLYGLPRMPPADPDRLAAYDAGRAAGETEAAAADERVLAALPPVGGDVIPW